MRRRSQSVIVKVLLAVSTVAAPGSRSVIVKLADAALSARMSQDTDCEPPGAMDGSVCVALCGFSSRIESVGLNVARTV
jgi:hypothetical protein